MRPMFTLDPDGSARPVLSVPGGAPATIQVLPPSTSGNARPPVDPMLAGNPFSPIGDVDASGFGMGQRGQRFSIIVEDGVATHVNVEAPGEFRVSAAEYALEQL